MEQGKIQLAFPGFSSSRFVSLILIKEVFG
jgi:hypothetical protein